MKISSSPILAAMNPTNTLKSLKLAFFWIQKAADQGHAEAKIAIGKFYLQGLREIASRDKYPIFYSINPQEIQQGVDLLEEVAQQGDAKIQYAVGDLLYNLSHKKNGEPEYKDRGLYWMQKAADQGHAEAIEVLIILTHV